MPEFITKASLYQVRMLMKKSPPNLICDGRGLRYKDFAAGQLGLSVSIATITRAALLEMYCLSPGIGGDFIITSTQPLKQTNSLLNTIKNYFIERKIKNG